MPTQQLDQFGRPQLATGPGFNRRFSSVSLGTVIGNTQVFDCDGSSVTTFYVGTSTTGTFKFQVSADGTNYVDAQTFDISQLAWISSDPITPTSGRVYKINTAAWRKVQAITVATLGGTVALTATMGNAPDPALSSAPGRNRESASTITTNGGTVTVDTGGFEQLAIQLAGTWAGTIVAEWTVDGTNWTTDNAVLDNASDIWLSGTLVDTSSGTTRVWFADASAIRAYRIRATAWTSGTLTVTFTAARGVAVGYSFYQNPPPHKFGFTQVNKVAQYTTTQTGTALWTPASGKRIVITSYQIQVGGTTAGTMQLWFGAAADTTYTRGTDYAIFDGEFAPSSTLKPGVVQTGMWTADAVDRVLRVTDSAAINPLTITVWGYEAKD